MIMVRDICTVFTFCFHPQPRGGPELLGAPLFQGTLTPFLEHSWLAHSGVWVRAHWSKGQSRVKAGSECSKMCMDGVLGSEVRSRVRVPTNKGRRRSELLKFWNKIGVIRRNIRNGSPEQGRQGTQAAGATELQFWSLCKRKQKNNVWNSNQ